MFCENSITTQLGGAYLEIDQVVTVSYQQLDDCVASAKSLTPEQRASWQEYANYTVFDVSDINPVNNSSAVVTPQPTTPAPAQTPEPTSSMPEGKAPEAAKPAPTANEAKQKAPAYWWYIGAGALVIIYFILDGPLPGKRTRR